LTGKQHKAHKAQKAQKANVIDSFSSCKKKRGKFTLAVAGEVKAGKSTYINALLGEEILPADVLQTSSAIVEIFKSEKSFLSVKYASGKKERIYDDLETPDIDEAKERLHVICRISDEHRGIPTTLIDTYIVESSTKIKVNNAFVEQLEEHSGEHLKDKVSTLKKYVKDRTKDKIPVEIGFGYPLKWDVNELRIVDSPGVNATGGVQNISFRFFEQADAILFVHPIIPIESESFRNFVNSVIPNRSKETLFLILTHAGLYSDEEVERLHKEAGRLYKNVIPENRILVVDSLLKLIHSDLKNGVSVEEIRKAENKKKILSSYREKASEEARELINVVYESSRFEKMFSAIDEFSMAAPNLQLQYILEKIITGYEEQENQYTEKIERLKKKRKNPQEFENEITRINEALTEFELSTQQTKEDLISRYTGRHSIWQKDVNALKAKHPELITGAVNFVSVRKSFVDAFNEMREKANAFSKELTKELKEALAKTGNSFTTIHKISIPKVDLNALEKEAKKSAYRKEDIFEKRSVDFWDYITLGIARAYRNNEVKVGTKNVFDKAQHLETYKSKCHETFYKRVNDLPNKSEKILNLYLDLFSKKMKSVIEERKKALQKEKENKQTNEEIIDEMKFIDREKKALQPEMSELIEILEDVK
jgi:hypothetical protein